MSKKLAENSSVAKLMLSDAVLLSSAAQLSSKLIDCYRKGGKLLIFGNGGSASQSQHIAAEFSGKYLRARKALPAISLTENISSLTAIGNDYGFERVFSRQLEAFAQKGDIAIGISTSGNSPNVLEALKYAKEKGIFCVALTGKDKCKVDALADIVIKVPSSATPRIQEMHLLVLHTVCEEVEEALFG